MEFPFRGETKVLNDDTRKNAVSGAYVQLSQGITHYQINNATSSPLVILVHGFSIAYTVYDPLYNFLDQAGVRVLRYDLFGRGFSDRPHTRYNIKLFTNQLAEIADHFSPNEPVVVCGLSMGGPITTSFLAQHPKRVAKHILIDPSGARAIDQTALLRAAKLPIVAELFYSLFGTDHLVNSLAKDFYDPKLVDDLKQHYRVQMQYKGYKRAILSTIRNNMLGDFIDSYRKAGKHKKPTLLLWGKDDTTVPLDHSTDICRAIPHTQIYIIEGCGHLPHYEKPEFVNPLILNFIKESQ